MIAIGLEAKLEEQRRESGATAQALKDAVAQKKEELLKKERVRRTVHDCDVLYYTIRYSR